ncbi:hypothetical protein O6H91_10G039400 [Diphasiastrum complanatum]|uniref:Uncharacterized protein n=2 Tax=Diphasiastrum complanatum TaxID=34168 RepID=A0ACC2CG40_DIPCM|nr:hypothetical protein O6H91_10G039400 [Diphasiastrum complanatum]KAJ7540972.1 hypothetical protein O6H91_10G039400 [Diphasiastrum complanatum]
MGVIQDYDDFVQVHGILLASSGLPSSLYPQLFEKLAGDVFDAGSFFQIEACEGGRQRRLKLSCSTGIQKHSHVFLVDHAWSFRLTEARKQRGLSLWGNRLESREAVLPALSTCTNLRALWLNETPLDLEGGDALKSLVTSALPQLEIYNSKFTNNYGYWAVGFCGGLFGFDKPYEYPNVSQALQELKDVDLSNRGAHKLSPMVFNERVLPNLSSLNLKGNPLDADSISSLLEVLNSLPSLQILEVDVPGPLGRSASKIAEALRNLAKLNGVDASQILEEDQQYVVNNLKPRLITCSKEEPLVERVLHAMWAYIMTYRLASEEKLDETPIWYVMDELGSALRHNDEPNFMVSPFMYLPDGTLDSAISYTLLWPIQDIYEGEECTRDYLRGIGEDRQRSSRLNAWFHTPREFFDQAYKIHEQRLKGTVQKPLYTAYCPRTSILPNDGPPISVYTDIPHVLEYLKRHEFLLIDKPHKATIIWTGFQVDEVFKEAVGLQAHQYVNQFPFEACLVMKHYLAQTIQQGCGAPNWLPTTYNLESQLPALIGDFNQRAEKGENNFWILKPWNMARTIDTTITESLPAIIRLMETGPKICQKYIETPALFQGRKFDLRYIVLLRSIQPLEIFLSDVFWARLANHRYTLEESSLSDYETHFTVMNYRGKMNHIDTHVFVSDFEKEHRVSWLEIHSRVRVMLRSIFEAAPALYPKMHCPKARAIYGVDVMLDNSFQPKLLEPFPRV